MSKYTLVNYFDVWGNAKDGWEVNDSRIEKTGIEIDSKDSDKTILKKLVEIGFLNTSDMRKLRLDDHGIDIEIYAIKGNYPLGRLDLEEY